MMVKGATRDLQELYCLLKTDRFVVDVPVLNNSIISYCRICVRYVPWIDLKFGCSTTGV